MKSPRPLLDQSMNALSAMDEFIPVSVVVPAFNVGEFIVDCIQSINQVISPAEIIIVDDCSTDDTLQVVHALQKAHQNIKVLRTSANQGAHAARSLGARQTKYDLIAFVDADDFLERGAISDAYQRMLHSSFLIDMCIWDVWRVTPEGKEFRAPCNPVFLPVTGQEALRMTLGSWDIHPLGLIRKELYIKACDYLHLNCLDSDELISRLLFREAGVVMGCSKRYFYRINPNSVTHRVSDSSLSRLRSNLWLCELALQVPGSRINSVARQGIQMAFAMCVIRKRFSNDIFNSEIGAYLGRIRRSRIHWRASIARPLVLVKLCFLLAYARCKQI